MVMAIPCRNINRLARMAFELDGVVTSSGVQGVRRVVIVGGASVSILSKNDVIAIPCR